jgi:hypothetical protein
LPVNLAVKDCAFNLNEINDERSAVRPEPNRFRISGSFEEVEKSAEHGLATSRGGLLWNLDR